jgi:hypothetical protein
MKRVSLSCSTHGSGNRFRGECVDPDRGVRVGRGRIGLDWRSAKKETVFLSGAKDPLAQRRDSRCAKRRIETVRTNTAASCRALRAGVLRVRSA